MKFFWFLIVILASRVDGGLADLGRTRERVLGATIRAEPPRLSLILPLILIWFGVLAIWWPWVAVEPV